MQELLSFVWRFSEVMLARKEEQQNLFKNMLWSGEVIFQVGGFINRCNSHYLALENPYVSFRLETMRTLVQVKVWCGFTVDHFIGP